MGHKQKLLRHFPREIESKVASVRGAVIASGGEGCRVDGEGREVAVFGKEIWEDAGKVVTAVGETGGEDEGVEKARGEEGEGEEEEEEEEQETAGMIERQTVGVKVFWRRMRVRRRREENEDEE